MKSRIDPMIWATAYALITPLVLGVLANWSRLPAIFHDQAAAGWAQAIGAFMAIIAAWMFGSRDIRAQAEARRADRREFGQTLLQLATYAVEVVGREVSSVRNLTAQDHYEGQYVWAFQDLIAALQALDPSRLSTAEAALSVQQIVRALRQGDFVVDRAKADFAASGGVSAALDDMLTQWLKSVVSARDKIVEMTGSDRAA